MQCSLWKRSWMLIKDDVRRIACGTATSRLLSVIFGTGIELSALWLMAFAVPMAHTAISYQDPRIHLTGVWGIPCLTSQDRGYSTALAYLQPLLRTDDCHMPSCDAYDWYIEKARKQKKHEWQRAVRQICELVEFEKASCFAMTFNDSSEILIKCNAQNQLLSISITTTVAEAEVIRWIESINKSSTFLDSRVKNQKMTERL